MSKTKSIKVLKEMLKKQCREQNELNKHNEETLNKQPFNIDAYYLKSTDPYVALVRKRIETLDNKKYLTYKFYQYFCDTIFYCDLDDEDTIIKVKFELMRNETISLNSLTLLYSFIEHCLDDSVNHNLDEIRERNLKEYEVTYNELQKNKTFKCVATSSDDAKKVFLKSPFMYYTVRDTDKEITLVKSSEIKMSRDFNIISAS